MKLFDTPKLGGALAPVDEALAAEEIRTAAQLDAERFDVVQYHGANRAERRRLKKAGLYVPRVVNTPLERKP